jgi:hypothetical protein
MKERKKQYFYSFMDFSDADLTDFSKELELVPSDAYSHSHTCS